MLSFAEMKYERDGKKYQGQISRIRRFDVEKLQKNIQITVTSDGPADVEITRKEVRNEAEMAVGILGDVYWGDAQFSKVEYNQEESITQVEIEVTCNKTGERPWLYVAMYLPKDAQCEIVKERYEGNNVIYQLELQ